MANILKKLKLVEISSLLLHEEHEKKRLQKMEQKIISDNYFMNPILIKVINFEKNLVLDGAHRVQALRNLNIKYIPVQVLETKEIQINTWCHLTEGNDWFYKNVLYNSDYEVSEKPLRKSLICNIYTDTKIFHIYCNNAYFLNSWKKLVSLFNEGHVVRLPNLDNLSLKDGEIVVEYPELSCAEIENIVLQEQTLPSGISRVQPCERILNLKVPLELLRNHEDDKWVNFLDDIKYRLRYYSEPVYILD
ncbi:ParB N-terminal domain-containing protein [Cytobacillus praedii]|uniref:ParB N-terminal domain-containing protein n=1 Tax=Cytobacillus praedii TaxID=1742358 RepID=UPI002E209E2F|nr:ParB N-terminal domain-containing protein [Cytobacillus praedii]